MKSFRKELWFETPTRRAFINITPQVEGALAESKIGEGLCLINAMHISATVFINDDESGLLADIEKWLEKLAPESPDSLSQWLSSATSGQSQGKVATRKLPVSAFQKNTA
jgi:thiamine phosphate synthase YjbQ (UPF0047 family)